MEFYDALGDRQTHTESVRFNAAGPNKTVERTKDILDLRLGNSRSAVVDFEYDIVCTGRVRTAYVYFHMAAYRQRWSWNRLRTLLLYFFTITSKEIKVCLHKLLGNLEIVASQFPRDSAQCSSLLHFSFLQ